MQVEILAHRVAIQQAVLKARFHAEQLAALVVPKMDCVSDPSFISTEDRLPVACPELRRDIQCLIDETRLRARLPSGLPTTVSGQAAYEQAKSAFDQFNWFSYNRPDSLTRRGDVLIARRALSNGRSHDSAIDEWQELVEDLFDGQVVIYDINVDRKNNLRVRFSLVDSSTNAFS